MKLTPLGDRLVVRTLGVDEVTPTGIVLPDTAQEKPQRGEVLAVGPGRLDEGERIPVDLVAGDTVVFTKYGGTEVRVDGEDLLILRESDVLAKEV
jgi:chaperonin GroES